MADKEAWRTAAASEWRANWKVGLAAFLALGLSFGAFQAVSSLFVLPLEEAFGWSRGQIALAQNAALAAAVVAPFLGRVIDRFGVRRLMLGGMTLSVTIYLGLAAMNGSLGLYYLLYVLAATIGMTASGLTCSRIVSEAFVRTRGFSLAVARSGLALTSALLPTALFLVIHNFGWRAGYGLLAALVLFLALPATYFWVGRKNSGGKVIGAGSGAGVLNWRQIFSDRRIFFLCLGAGLGYAPATAIMSQLQPLLVGKGVEIGRAASLVGVAGAASFIGALITGTLVDRFWAPAVAFVFSCGSAAGTLILVFSTGLDSWTAASAILLIGLGLGAEIDVVAYMVARYFGVSSFASIYGLASCSIAVFGAAGASMLGLSFDHYGNYDFALLIIAGCFLAAGIVYMLLGPYPQAGQSEEEATGAPAPVPSPESA